MAGQELAQHQGRRHQKQLSPIGRQPGVQVWSLVATSGLASSGVSGKVPKPLTDYDPHTKATPKLGGFDLGVRSFGAASNRRSLRVYLTGKGLRA